MRKNLKTISIIGLFLFWPRWLPLPWRPRRTRLRAKKVL